MKNNNQHIDFYCPLKWMCLSLLLVLSTISFSQPGVKITPADKKVDVNENFIVSVLAKSFTNIESVQFSLSWDPDVLQFDTFDIDLSEQLFLNFNNVAEGKFSMIWLPNNVTTFPDNTPFITAHFKGLLDGKSPFEFTDEPTPAFVAYLDVDGNPVDTALVVYQNGMITVGDFVSTNFTQDKRDFNLYQNYPNPFSENTSIPFDLKKSDTITLVIFDINGKKIFQYSKLYGEGTHHITIDKEVLPHPGVYLYEVQTSNELLTKQMILVK